MPYGTRSLGRVRGTVLAVLGVEALALVGLGVAGLAAAGVGAAAAGPTCGASWSANNPPSVGSLLSLTGVSGVAGGDVFAVGYGDPGHNRVESPVSDMWNGTSWSSVPVQAVTTSVSQFNGVSMSSPTNGWAVGWASSKNTKDYQTLAEEWNGSAWNAVSTPNVGTGNNLLMSVAELSGTDAWAVGYSTGAVRQNLAEHWDGTSWSVVPAPNVGLGANSLLGVAGSAPNDVWAVGYSTAASGFQTLIEHFDGTSWSVVPIPPAGPVDNVLTAVTTSGPTDAWAVGYQTTAGGQYQALVEHWDGTAWSVASLPAPTDGVDVLRGVAASSPTDVWAVGSRLEPVSGNYVSFTLHWDGTIWTPTYPASGPTQLRAVTTVPGTGQWWAVGAVTPDPLAYQLCESGAARANAGTSLLRPTEIAVGASGRGTTESARPEPHSGLSRPTLRSATPVPPVFATDVGAGAGLPPVSYSAADAVADFGNGHPDIFLSGNTTNGGGKGALYVNDGSGRFSATDQTSFPPADRRSCDTADTFGSGMTDIFCTVGAQNGNEMKADNLFVEGPGLTFTDRAVADGLADPFSRGGSATFVMGASGRPDLFVGATPTRSDGIPEPNRFYVNTGSGFVDSPQLGLDQEIGAHCASSGDYNGDGNADLLMCGDNAFHLYQNNGANGFSDVTGAVGLPTSAGVQDAIFSDLNGDGRLDVVMVTTRNLQVYLQNSDHTFTESYTMKLTAGVSVTAGDVNGDGVPDLYVVQGQSGRVKNEPDLMLLNNGSGNGFTPMTVPQVTTGVGSRAVPINFEGNGLTDFLVFNDKGGASPAPLQLLAFFPATAPTITSARSATFAVGSPVSFTVTTSGAPAPSLTEAGSLPAGVSFQDDGNGTATISGSSAATGTFPITITASNGITPDATQSFTLAIDSPPTISSDVPAQMAVGAKGTVTFTGTGFQPGTAISLSGPSGGVQVRSPTVVDATTLTAKIHVPTGVAVGAYTVTVVNTDGLHADCLACFSVIAAPTLTGMAPASAAEGTVVPVTLTGTGFAGGAVVQGPKGVTFTSVAVVSPTTITATMRVSATAATGTALKVTVVNTVAAGNGRAIGDLLTIT